MFQNASLPDAMIPRSILFINRVYPPAEGATGQLLEELAEALVKRGWNVTVVTGGTGAVAARSETVRGVRVERVGGLAFSRANHLRRLFSYLSLYPALLWRALRMPRADVVVTLTDPPLQLLLGPIILALKGSRLVHWAQDIYPELAEELDVLQRGGLIAGTLRWLSTWALRRGERVIAVGRCMKRRLMERGIAADRITVIPNWGHAGGQDSTGPDDGNAFRRENNLNGRFVVMYSGNLGLAHPFEAILDAADRLRAGLPQVLFLFVGDGPRLPWVREQAERRGLSNVRFLPFQPKARLPESLAAADLHLATMRHELCGLVVPSKVYGVLAAGRPCVFLGPAESEAAQIIRQNGCGSVLVNSTGARLASCLTLWATNSAQLEEAGDRAADLADSIGLRTAVSAFETVLNGAVNSEAILLPESMAVLCPEKTSSLRSVFRSTGV